MTLSKQRSGLSGRIVSVHAAGWRVFPRRCIAALALTAALAPGLAGGAEDAAAVRFLSAPAKADAPLTLTIKPGTDVGLPFAAPAGRALEFYLSPFLGEHGDVVTAELSILELPGAQAKDQRLAFSADRPMMTLSLKVPALPTAGKYSGTLAVLEQGKVIGTRQITLVRGLAQRPAKLSVDPKSVTAYQVAGPLAAVDAAFTVQAGNVSVDWPVDGVYLRFLEANIPAGTSFDPLRNLKLSWNGKPADDLWHSPATGRGARSLAPNQKVDLHGEPVGLAPGEYTVKLGLAAANVPADGEAQFTLKLFVKHGVVPPLIVLLLAITVSYLATKGLDAQRRRVARLAKLAEMRPAWLREEPAVMPVVATRAILRQMEDRNRRWYDSLFGQDTTDALIAKAGQMLKLLQRVHGLRERIRTSGWDRMVVHRANKVLNSIVRSISPDALDESAMKQIEADLAAMDKWFESGPRAEMYRIELLKEVDALAAQVEPDSFRKQDRAVVTALLDRISKNRPKDPSLPELVQVEVAYAKLKILRERNQDGDDKSLDALVKLLKADLDVNIEEFFAVADQMAWRDLTRKPGDFDFVAPVKNDVDPLQAYRLIRFEIAPRNRKLGNNYLFKHKAFYEWSLALETGGVVRMLTQPTTNEPRVIQYIPESGKLYVSVVVSHDGMQSQRIDYGPLDIRESAEFRFRSAFRFNEMVALGIATVFALISGLATFYFGKHAFGTVNDYIGLFLWGAGVDQTKNFLQNLERTSGAAKT